MFSGVIFVLVVGVVGGGVVLLFELLLVISLRMLDCLKGLMFFICNWCIVLKFDVMVSLCFCVICCVICSWCLVRFFLWMLFKFVLVVILVVVDMFGFIDWIGLGVGFCVLGVGVVLGF